MKHLEQKLLVHQKPIIFTHKKLEQKLLVTLCTNYFYASFLSVTYVDKTCLLLGVLTR